MMNAYGEPALVSDTDPTPRLMRLLPISKKKPSLPTFPVLSLTDVYLLLVMDKAVVVVMGMVVAEVEAVVEVEAEEEEVEVEVVVVEDVDKVDMVTFPKMSLTTIQRSMYCAAVVLLGLWWLNAVFKSEAE